MIMMMQDYKMQCCCSEFPWARERFSSIIVDNLSTRCLKGSSTLFYSPVQGFETTTVHFVIGLSFFNSGSSTRHFMPELAG